MAKGIASVTVISKLPPSPRCLEAIKNIPPMLRIPSRKALIKGQNPARLDKISLLASDPFFLNANQLTTPIEKEKVA